MPRNRASRPPRPETPRAPSRARARHPLRPRRAPSRSSPRRGHEPAPCRGPYPASPQIPHRASYRLLGQRRREPPHLLDEAKPAQIGHAHWIENAVEVVAFMLDDTRVEACRRPVDGTSVEVEAAVTYTPEAGHGTHETAQRQAGFPAEDLVLIERLDLGIDENRERLGPVAGLLGDALGRHLEDHDAERNMDLGRRQPRPRRILHGVDHVGGKLPYLGSRRILDGASRLAQHRMAHAGDLENSHRVYYAMARRQGKGSSRRRSDPNTCSTISCRGPGSRGVPGSARLPRRSALHSRAWLC